jgi:nucleotide-binding universal stress UspA family protein
MSEQQDGTGQRIVVGVDGSPSSMAALKWAVRQAELTGGSVEAVTTWRSPPLVGIGAPFSEAEVGGGDDSRIRLAAENMLRAAIAEASGQSGVHITAEVGEGSAAQMLLDLAAGASLVIVGSRGHGGITGTLLGSVGQTLAQHSPCPVLIIRGVE